MAIELVCQVCGSDRLQMTKVRWGNLDRSTIVGTGHCYECDIEFIITYTPESIEEGVYYEND
jgi:hypothetical protein